MILVACDPLKNMVLGSPIGADPKHVGAQLGVTAVLHTWGRTLQHHPHVHCVVPGGGPRSTANAGSPAGPASSCRCASSHACSAACSCKAWRTRSTRASWASLAISPALPIPPRAPSASTSFDRLTGVVYAKPPFGGPKQVLAYLGGYTHRVAIANSRLTSLSDGKVYFSCKDYRQNSKTKVMTLNAADFIQRFLLHSLPGGFHLIRHNGLFRRSRAY
jgi:hypothetical protein